MISFEPTEDEAMMVSQVAGFARSLREGMRAAEKARELTTAARETAHAMGLTSASLPTWAHGPGLPLVTAVLLEEEIAAGDPAAAFGFGGAGAFGRAVVELSASRPEVAAALLLSFAANPHAFGAVLYGEPRPAEHPGLVTRAERTDAGYTLSGEKAYAINADRAETLLVFAQVDPALGWKGLGAFVVPAETPGMTLSPRRTSLGLDVASFGGAVLERLELPASACLSQGEALVPALLRFFVKEGLLVAARAVGLARAAFDVTLEYAQTRRAFGKPIGHFQAVAFTLADRAMDLEASRGLVHRAAAAWDAYAALPQDTNPKKLAKSEREALLRSAQAIAFAGEAAMRAGDDAVQLHGGAGFIRDYPVEKYMRDAKQLELCGMTAEQADQLAAAIELDRPIDPELVFPSAASQSTFL